MLLCVKESSNNSRLRNVLLLSFGFIVTQCCCLQVDISVCWQGTEVVPSNARSHTCLLSGVFMGNVKVLVRLSFGIDGPKQVAMKLAVRSDAPAISDAIHEIVANG